MHPATLTAPCSRTASCARPAASGRPIAKFADAGWVGLAAPEALGGQGLPWLWQAAANELWAAANVSFQLCPLLSQACSTPSITTVPPSSSELYGEPLASGRGPGPCA